MIIYKITNLINNKIYIGQTTKTAECRFDRHWKERNCFDRYLHKALRKYNKNDFKIEVLASAKCKKDLDFLEIYFIKYYNSNNCEIGYNLTLGGEGGLRSPEAIEKGAKKLRGKKRPKSVCKKISKGLKGRKMTEAQIKKSVKNRKANSGYKNSQLKRKINLKTPDGKILKFESTKSAAEYLKVSNASISLLKSGRLKTVKNHRLDKMGDL